MSLVWLDDLRLNAELSGPDTAPPLVLIHGLGLDLRLMLAHQIADRLAAHPAVVAVSLGGSGGTLGLGTDAASDLDLEVFTRGEVPLEVRRAATAATGGATRAELGNGWWGLADEWIAADSGIYVDLTFFDAAHRDVLDFCGSYSGRDVDKVAATGLTPVVGSTGAIYFDEARLVIECRKLYTQDLQENGFVDPQIVDRNYPTRDFHRMYVGEVVRMLVREG